MGTKIKTLFVCQQCGAQSPAWYGRCPGCESWNSLVEENVFRGDGNAAVRAVAGAGEKPTVLAEVTVDSAVRMTTHIAEFDRVMGGGVVAGSVTLIGGDPGIGKSTLSLQVACALSKKRHAVLYVSAEESAKQVKLRADRLGVLKTERLYIVNQADLTGIIEHINALTPAVVVIDSIQVIFQPQLSSGPGSVSQVRECAGVLTQLAKATGMAMFIIGHVTKEGMLAGPRVMEHIVDTVLYFEGERYSHYRVLRATKNRFGSTNEIGVFEMSAAGLTEVPNPSEVFLSERPADTAGSAVVPIVEGTRPFLVEIQGLVSRANFGMARQKAQGFDANRLALLAAVLEKKIGLNLRDKDIFLNVVGGMTVADPAADLGVAVAVATALSDKAVRSDTVVIGEIGLSAEIRSVSHIAIRVNEAQKLGFKRCMIPKNNLKGNDIFRESAIDIVPVETVRQALDYL